MAKLQFEVEEYKLPNGVPVMLTNVVGIIDGQTFNNFEKHIGEFFDRGYHNLVIVLKGVTYINSTGMGLLVKLAEKYKKAGGDIKLVNIPERVNTIFKMLGFSNYFAIFETREQAIASLSESVSDAISPNEDDFAETQKTSASLSSSETNSQPFSELFNDDSEALVIEEEDDLGLFPSEEDDSAEMPIDCKDRRRTSHRVTGHKVADALPIDIEREISPDPKTSLKKKSNKTEKLKREVAVRYFKRMNPFRSFPLLAILSRDQIEQSSEEKFTQAKGKPLFLEEKSSLIEIVPVMPGCLVSPYRKRLDAFPKRVEARFEVTPLAPGNYKRACIEIYSRGRLLQSVSVPNKVVKKTMAKVSLFLGIISPAVSSLVDIFSADLRQRLPRVTAWLAKYTGDLQHFHIGMILAGVFLLSAVFFYLLRRPQKAGPAESSIEIRRRS